jgi:hypothetical protein
MASTYVNDLRLEEIGTGDQSGTWGNTTNLNLELIGQALGYATQQVFSSDADATTTIADGASDPARAMYFKITSAGSLTATRTCTIAPNTISRVMFIENATSGSQSIAISQGSGASVTILTGKTAVVYLDGAGAGAAVVDAMLGVDPGVTDTLTEVLVAGNTSGGTNIELSTTDKVQFRDAAIYINSSVDGQLDIVADTEIQIAATTVDLNGNLDVSGTALVTGVLTTTAATVFNGGFASNADSTLGTDKKVQFRDSAIYINSSADGQLDIVADTEIQIAATTVDLNGDLDVSGTTLVTGVLTTTAATVFNGGFASNADSTLGTDKKVQFRDAAIYINSSVDGQLDIVADTEIQIAATTVDLNGNLDVSGNVGIGTTSPSYILDVTGASADVAKFKRSSVGTTEVLIDTAGSGDAQLVFADNGTDSYAIGRDNTNGDFVIAASGALGTSNLINIESGGNVGIGTDSPSVNTEIRGSASNGQLRLGGSTTATYANIYSDNDGILILGADAGNNAASSYFGVEVDGTERMRIDSSGNVGIGTATTNAVRLTATTATANHIGLIVENSNAADSFGMVVKAGNDANDYTADFRKRDNTTIMRIRGDGNVGIGTSSPSEDLHVSGTGDRNIAVESTNTGAGANAGIKILAADGGDFLWQTGNATGNALRLYDLNATAERIRINSSGHTMFATTDDAPGAGNTQSGVAIRGGSDNRSFFSASSNYVAAFNRNTNSGPIVEFNKDGAGVGSIGVVASNYLSIGTGDTGLLFQDDNDFIEPCNVGTSAGRDAAIDLGHSGGRFKDLYLSGGVYLGGTGAANHLEDYEEGLYTVAITCGTSGTITVNSSFDQATYTKVGRLVTVTGLLAISAISSPVGSFSLSLPFTAAALAQRAVDSAGSIILDDTVSANCSDFIANIVENTASITIRLGDATDLQFDSAQQVKAGTNIIFSASYVAA